MPPKREWKARGRRFPMTPGELRKIERRKATLEKYRKIREENQN